MGPMARTTRRRSRARGYLTAFPYPPSNPVVKAYAHAHGGDPQTFGLPSYTATMANATAIQTACKAHGNKITRTEVRQAIQKTTLTATQGLLGFPVSFLSKNSGLYAGPGDLGGKASYFVYKIQANGTYKRVQ